MRPAAFKARVWRSSRWSCGDPGVSDERAGEDRGLGAEKIVGGLAGHRGGRASPGNVVATGKCRKSGAVGVVGHPKSSTRFPDSSGALGQ